MTRRAGKLPADIVVIAAVIVAACVLFYVVPLISGAGAHKIFAGDGVSDTANEIVDAVLFPEYAGLTVCFIDVGQGDCALICEKSGACAIFDAGTNDSEKAVLAFLGAVGVKKLDYAFFTHPHADHIGGADAVLLACETDTVVMTDVTAEVPCCEKLAAAVSESGSNTVTAKVGDVFTLGDAYISVLAPIGSYEDVNDSSLVLKVTYGGISFLLAADAGEPSERDMIASGADLSADVLKLGHHGAAGSTCDDFLALVSPSHAVASVSLGNDFAHPDVSVAERLERCASVLLRTDLDGTVVFSTNGADLGVRTEKPKD